MSKDDVKLHLDDDNLVISGEKRNVDERTEDGVYRSERFYGAIRRVVPLPADVDQEHAEAEFRNGVLNIRLPKLAEVTPVRRQIAIKGG